MFPYSSSTAKGKEKKDDNPLSFFKHTGVVDRDPILPSLNPSRSFSKSSLFDEDEDFDLILPKKKNTPSKFSFEDEDDEIPPLPQSIRDLDLNPDPPKLGKATSKLPDDAEKDKLSRKLQQAEMTILGYEEKLKQANKTIDKLKEKEEQETLEMERALKLIEKKLSEMQKRAESAEFENEKLKKQLKKQESFNNSAGPNLEMQTIHEKTNYVVNHMNKMALESEQSIRSLLNLSKEFGTLMDMLQTLDKITNVNEK